jgi:hypothetical protein
MAWITVKAKQAGNVTINTRNVSAVGEKFGACWVLLVGDAEGIMTVEGTRETLVNRILAAERSERLERG